MKALLAALALACTSWPAAAQPSSEPPFKSTCEEGQQVYQYGSTRRYCEIRELSMRTPAGQPLTINAGASGGISVQGWDGPNVRIRARVQSWGRSEAEAQTQAKAVTIGSSGNTLKAQAPGENEQYSVSYEVFVPRQLDLVLNTTNGGISLSDLRSDIRFDAVNGGVTLAGLGGKVTGHTVNGGLNIVLSGPRWNGSGLDVQTTNGGIRWTLPADYSAQLLTSTNMGQIRSAFPITRTGLLNKELALTMGKGGPAVKAITTNGSISLNQSRN